MMKAKLLLECWRTLLGSRQEYPPKYLSTSIHTRTHIHTYIGTGPASRICLQRRLNLNLMSGYRRIQTKTALFCHSRGSHAVSHFLKWHPIHWAQCHSEAGRLVLEHLQSKFIGYKRRSLLRLCLAIMVFFFLKKKKKHCFLQICLALNLFLHTADLSQGHIQKLHLVGFLSSIYEHVQFIDEYIQMLAGEAFSLIQRPNSELYLQTRSVVKRLMPSSESYTPARGAFFHGLCLIPQHRNPRFLKPR